MRIRTIKPELLSEHGTATLTDSQWRTFVSLYPLADDDGRFRASVGYIAGAAYWGTGKTAAEVADDLAELQRRGLIVRYDANGAPFGAVGGWRDKGSLTYQLINKYTPSRLPGPDGSTPVPLPEDSGTSTDGKGMDLDQGSGNRKGKEGKGKDRVARDARAPLHLDALRLARSFRSLIASANPRTKIAKLSPEASEEWAVKHGAEIEKLNRLDGIDWTDIEKAITFATSDSFWAPNILSGKKLREKYDQLAMQMRRGPAKTTAKAPDFTKTDYTAVPSWMKGAS